MANKIQKKKQKFVQVANSFIRDENISFKAKGLFCYMFSMSEDWNFTIRSIAKQQKDGEASIISSMKELKEYGYITYTKHQDGTGTYFLDDEPKLEKPNVENPNLGKSTRIKKNQLTKNKNSKAAPTLEEIKAYIQEKNINVDGIQFFNYFDVSNWVDSKGNKVKNWKQKLLTWANYNKPKSGTSSSHNISNAEEYIV